MMITTTTIEYWRNHVSQAGLHPVSKLAYCKEQNLRFSTYYRWSKRFKDESLHQKKSKSNSANKKDRPVFLPVEIAADKFNFKNRSRSSTLPDARWVAEVMLYLSQGLL